MDYIFLDVDSKDPSLGLSAPPSSFLTPTALEDIYSLLEPGGSDCQCCGSYRPCW